MLSKNCIGQAQRCEFSSKPARPDISVVVNAKHHIVTRFQGCSNSSEKISIKTGTGVRGRAALLLKVPDLLAPDRAKRGWIPAGPIGRKVCNGGAMLSFEAKESPPPKAGRISANRSLVG